MLCSIFDPSFALCRTFHATGVHRRRFLRLRRARVSDVPADACIQQRPTLPLLRKMQGRSTRIRLTNSSKAILGLAKSSFSMLLLIKFFFCKEPREGLFGTLSGSLVIHKLVPKQFAVLNRALRTSKLSFNLAEGPLKSGVDTHMFLMTPQARIGLERILPGLGWAFSGLEWFVQA